MVHEGRIVVTLGAVLALYACSPDSEDRESPEPTPTVTPMDSVELEALARDVGVECEEGQYYGYPVYCSFNGERVLVSSGDLGDEIVRRAGCGGGGISNDLHFVLGTGFTMIPLHRETAEELAAATGGTVERYCP